MGYITSLEHFVRQEVRNLDMCLRQFEFWFLQIFCYIFIFRNRLYLKITKSELIIIWMLNMHHCFMHSLEQFFLVPGIWLHNNLLQNIHWFAKLTKKIHFLKKKKKTHFMDTLWFSSAMQHIFWKPKYFLHT